MELSDRLVAMLPKAARQAVTDMNGRHVLIVDEDREHRVAIAAALEQHGFRVTTTGNGPAMQRALERARIDLVLVDPATGGDGSRLYRQLRATSDVPYIVVSRRADALDRILGLEMGAEDYLAKPAHPRELLARMRNVLRRAGGSHAGTSRERLYRFAGWQFDSVGRELRAPDGATLPMRNSEYRVLAILLAHGNQVVARQKLVELARGRDAGPFDRSIDVRISRLRQLLRDDARGPRIIKTVHGEGYVIGVPVERA